ncbi:MAG: pantoate--beta-alanine ligase [Planctomycetota bacterium]|nr:pantoate--beta-alanine ligase [Planctomycetota bacterium]
MTEVLAYLGLGANEGDRERNIRTALSSLGAVPGVRVVRCSKLVSSALFGEGPEQGEYLNGVAELATSLPAPALLSICRALEVAAGRRLPALRNHPRPLDLDLLLYGRETIDTRDLIVPHPRMWQRPFVLLPLRELGVDLALMPRPVRPLVVQDPAKFAALCSHWQAGACTTGLVPTMGALHPGHQSLIRKARAECDRVLVTIFVNPLQFSAGEDFAAYPRTLERDVQLCAEAGADAVFAPEPLQMYDSDFCSNVAVGAAAMTMEGAIRPTHFQGVATVVARLFALSRPHNAYFGKKDAQQLAVIQRMTLDLGFPIRVVECPIVREADGLAMSSRNVYLAPADRIASTVLVRALRAAQQAFASGERDRDRLLQVASSVLLQEPRAELDYLELRGEGDLRLLPAGPVVLGRMLVAAKFRAGKRVVRLLDNLSLAEPSEVGLSAGSVLFQGDRP